MTITSVDPQIQSRLEFALQLAVEAQRLILSYYQDAELAVELKGDTSPVTAADRGAEELIRARLAERFTSDAVLGEEFGESPGTSGYRWILDPVDGTKSFVHGVPLFGTLIGIEQGNECVAGVCRFPALNEVVYAALGGGAWWQVGDGAPRRARVQPVTQLKDATFCNTNPQRWYKHGKWDIYLKLLEDVQLSRGWGDCFGHMLVATGRAHLMVDPTMNPWDAAALKPIVEEAGGVFCDWKGQSTIYGGSGMSMTPGLRDEVLKRLA